MAWFNKYYRCPCGQLWQDEWDCLCNDRCPACNTECEPYDHAEIDEGSLTGDEKTMTILLIRKDSLNAEGRRFFNLPENGSDHRDGISGTDNPRDLTS